MDRTPVERPKRATVIELVIVVMVVLIVASLLMPVLPRNRALASQAQCRSNLTRIALGFAQYTQDYGQRYPLSCWCPASAPGCAAAHPATAERPTLWYHALDPYVKSVNVYNCPNAHYTPQHKDATGHWVYYSGTSYGWNVYWDPAMAAEVAPFKAAAVAGVGDPTGTLLLADSAGYYRVAGYTGSGLVNSAEIAPRHLAGANILWADYHVTCVNPSRLLYPQGAAVSGYWTLKAGD
jgi:type II secretory pathway pseudopilin PulG